MEYEGFGREGWIEVGVILDVMRDRVRVFDRIWGIKIWVIGRMG